MFEIKSSNGRSEPMLVCDICGDTIQDASKSAVVFRSGMVNNDRSKTMFVHKGKIDGMTCHEKADSLIRAENGIPGWQEFKTYLSHFASNVRFPPAEIAKYAEDMDMRDIFQPKHEPARSIYSAFQNEAKKRKGRSVEEWLTAERGAVLREATTQAIQMGLRAPTMYEVVRAERYATGLIDYGAKWAYGVVEAMRKKV